MKSHSSYAGTTPLELVGSERPPPEPRCIVLRAIDELGTVLALANSDIPVLLVIRVDEPVRQRVTDTIGGWASGAGVTPDWLGPNTVTLRTRRAPQMRLIDHGMADAATRALTDESTRTLTRGHEARLRRQARLGSVDARRRLIDAHAELATLMAVWLRPDSVSVERATRHAHEELDAIAANPSANTPLLVDLVNRIAKRLHRGRPDSAGTDT
jgi:hypothetical protein